jgi:hypothetical protein
MIMSDIHSSAQGVNMADFGCCEIGLCELRVKLTYQRNPKLYVLGSRNMLIVYVRRTREIFIVQQHANCKRLETLIIPARLCAKFTARRHSNFSDMERKCC